jgi:hypothetical protein
LVAATAALGGSGIDLPLYPKERPFARSSRLRLGRTKSSVVKSLLLSCLLGVLGALAVHPLRCVAAPEANIWYNAATPVFLSRRMRAVVGIEMEGAP